ncbi:MAG: hypothetical protein NT030_06195, partial [Candidatus Saganbacteria bacterium]|nr:hypothetical protein [Candidatus Saganbacteria bacterium]
MKKLFVFAVVCAMLFSLINASFAAGYLSGNIMSDPLAAGKMDFSQRIDSSIASETLDMGGSAPKWAPIDAHYSFTNLVLPMMFAFGLTDNISFRTTIPYVSTNMTNPYGGTLNGTGLGDIRSEVLFGLLKESAVVPSIAVNLGIKFPTGKFRDLAHITGIDFGGTDYYWYPELPTGTGGTDYSLSFILGKKLGPVNGK